MAVFLNSWVLNARPETVLVDRKLAFGVHLLHSPIDADAKQIQFAFFLLLNGCGRIHQGWHFDTKKSSMDETMVETVAMAMVMMVGAMVGAIVLVGMAVVGAMVVMAVEAMVGAMEVVPTWLNTIGINDGVI